MKICCVFISVLLLSCFNNYTIAQSRSDGKFLMKTWLFLEHVNEHERLEQINVKDSSLFELFNKIVDLKIDTLKANGFSKEYVFLSVAGYDTAKRMSYGAIRYGKTNLLGYMSVPEFCNSYVLCVNTVTGTSYRIEGFLGNDLINLLYAIRDDSITYKISTRKVQIKDILKKLSIQNVDLNCIYNALTIGKGDFSKYPCLGRCKNPVVSIN